MTFSICRAILGGEAAWASSGMGDLFLVFSSGAVSVDIRAGVRERKGCRLGL